MVTVLVAGKGVSYCTGYSQIVTQQPGFDHLLLCYFLSAATLYPPHQCWTRGDLAAFVHMKSPRFVPRMWPLVASLWLLLLLPTVVWSGVPYQYVQGPVYYLAPKGNCTALRGKTLEKCFRMNSPLQGDLTKSTGYNVPTNPVWVDIDGDGKLTTLLGWRRKEPLCLSPVLVRDAHTNRWPVV